MTNLHRGEISANLDGKPYTLCLTLGALAELEARLGGEDILALAQRFESGRITAREAIYVIGAGLRGAGHDIADDLVGRMQVDGGVPGYLSLVINLLQAAFGADEAPGTREGSGKALPLSWRRLMGLAFGQLRLAPEQFWRISPKELQAALDGYLNSGFGAEGLAVMGRRELNALCAQFPDQGVDDAPIDETGQGTGGTLQQSDQQLQRLSELRVRTREYSNDLRTLASAGRDTGEILARAFTGAALRGKDLSDSFRSVILSLSQKTLRTAANSFSGAVTSGLGNLFSGMMRNANGNAFSQGRVIPLARGGVVSGPSIFPMSGGAAGLMGEAGPEAIMPLTRGADGRLGVRAGDGGAGRPVTINFNVTTPDAEGLRRSEAQISAMLQRVAGRGGRNL